ncbi:MAG: hypothetical protein GW779_06745, partial [Candidatus Altiarchaeum hamiconexum]
NVITAWNNPTLGDYDVIADLNNDGIVQEREIDGMDDSNFVGFNVTSCVTPAPAPVPGLSDFGIIMLILALLFFGILKMRKTQQVQKG